MYLSKKIKIMSCKLFPSDMSVSDYYKHLNKNNMNEKKIKKIEQSIENLQQQLDSLKQPKIEVGKWYKSDKGGLWFIEEITSSNTQRSFGITHKRDWCESGRRSSTGLTPATYEEVEAALIKEAKKRGFKEGVRFKDVTDKKEWDYKYIGQLFKYNHNIPMYGKNHLKCGVGVCFKDGIWAEIIEEPKVIINGHEMKQEGDIISFGCAKFHKEDLKSWYWFTRNISWHTNRLIKSITLDSGVEISVEQLKEICDNIK